MVAHVALDRRMDRRAHALGVLRVDRPDVRGHHGGCAHGLWAGAIHDDAHDHEVQLVETDGSGLLPLGVAVEEWVGCIEKVLGPSRSSQKVSHCFHQSCLPNPRRTVAD